MVEFITPLTVVLGLAVLVTLPLAALGVKLWLNARQARREHVIRRMNK